MNDLYKIAAKCLKPIENQIYEADRQKVIEAIVVELENAKATIVVDGNSLKPESLFDGEAVTVVEEDGLIITIRKR